MVVGIAVYIIDSQWTQALQGHRYSVIPIRKCDCFQLIVFDIGDSIQWLLELERSTHHSTCSVYFPNQLNSGVLRECVNLCNEETDSVNWRTNNKNIVE